MARKSARASEMPGTWPAVGLPRRERAAAFSPDHEKSAPMTMAKTNRRDVAQLTHQG